MRYFFRLPQHPQQGFAVVLPFENVHYEPHSSETLLWGNRCDESVGADKWHIIDATHITAVVAAIPWRRDRMFIAEKPGEIVGTGHVADVDERQAEPDSDDDDGDAPEE